ncbi:MAG: peptide-methionine (S)-S-oxide reductase MsrA, partial [Dongiaceae bacterium]
MAKATFGAGCFWGVESAFRRLPGVIATAVGYTGGHKANPGYKEVCSDRTGHAEAVLVEYDPEKVTYEQLLDLFWEVHDPTQLNRQGPDYGSQYRTAIFFHDAAQEAAAKTSKEALAKSGKHRRPIVTEIVPAGDFRMAEDDHQQFFEKRGIAPTC